MAFFLESPIFPAGSQHWLRGIIGRTLKGLTSTGESWKALLLGRKKEVGSLSEAERSEKGMVQVVGTKDN